MVSVLCVVMIIKGWNPNIKARIATGMYWREIRERKSQYFLMMKESVRQIGKSEEVQLGTKGTRHLPWEKKEKGKSKMAGN